RKLLDKKVLVRKLLGIETAGSLNVLFSDKTGTITHGHLEYHKFISGDLESFGDVKEIPPTLWRALSFSLKHSTASQVDAQGHILGGNSSDRAFLAMLPDDVLRRVDDVDRRNDIIFSSMRKYSATTLSLKSTRALDLPKAMLSNGSFTIVKGAPEILLDRCGRYW